MSTKELLQYINTVQLATFISLPEYRKSTIYLDRKQRGLYWIWTNIPLEKLKTTIQEKEINEVKNRHVPIGELVSIRADLANICIIEEDRFRIVYNGIGGYPNDYKSSCLQQRINQELNCTNHKTGTLNFQNRKFKDNSGFEEENIAISYFNFDDIKHQEVLMKYSNQNKTWLNANFYNTYAKQLENLWRLQYGTPILCRQ